MLARFGDSYQEYLNRMGMFVPKFVERIFIKDGHRRGPLSLIRGATILVLLLAVIVGGGFILRSYTVHHLPLTDVTGIDVLTITDADNENAKDLIPALLADSTISARLQPSLKSEGHRVLAYFIPVDYVMQGMIANTGDEWKLFERHKTIAMITEYILHPYAHLVSGHAHHMAMMTGQVHDSTYVQQTRDEAQGNLCGYFITGPASRRSDRRFWDQCATEAAILCRYSSSHSRIAPGSRYSSGKWMGYRADANVLDFRILVGKIHLLRDIHALMTV